MRPLPLPDPPLEDAVTGILLRPWAPPDAEALAAAWADPQVAAHTAVPPAHDLPAAERWVAGEEQRRHRGLALDLVIAQGEGPAEVLGEVGLARLDRERRAEIGFWLAPEARGRGVATTAVRLLTTWALAPEGTGLGLRQVWARTAPDNRPAAAVLGRAGFHRTGEAGGTTVWTTGPAMLRP